MFGPPLGAEVLEHMQRYLRESEAFEGAVPRAGGKAADESARDLRLRKTIRIPEETVDRVEEARAALWHAVRPCAPRLRVRRPEPMQGRCLQHEGDHINRFDGYPAESIEDWHRSRGLWMN